MKKQGPRKLKYLFKVPHLETREARMKTSSDSGIWAFMFRNFNATFLDPIFPLSLFLPSFPLQISFN